VLIQKYQPLEVNDKSRIVKKAFKESIESFKGEITIAVKAFLTLPLRVFMV